MCIKIVKKNDHFLKMSAGLFNFQKIVSTYYLIKLRISLKSWHYQKSPTPTVADQFKFRGWYEARVWVLFEGAAGGWRVLFEGGRHHVHVLTSELGRGVSQFRCIRCACVDSCVCRNTVLCVHRNALSHTPCIHWRERDCRIEGFSSRLSGLSVSIIDRLTALPCPVS